VCLLYLRTILLGASSQYFYFQGCRYCPSSWRPPGAPMYVHVYVCVCACGGVCACVCACVHMQPSFSIPVPPPPHTHTQPPSTPTLTPHTSDEGTSIKWPGNRGEDGPKSPGKLRPPKIAPPCMCVCVCVCVCVCEAGKGLPPHLIHLFFHSL